MSLTVRQLLNHKTSGVYATRPDASVLEALELMAREDISSVLVMALVPYWSSKAIRSKVFLQSAITHVR